MAIGAGATDTLDGAICQYLTGSATALVPVAGWGASFMGLFTNNLTAATKDVSTGVEWSNASDTNYVRVTGGTGGTQSTSWTVVAYASGVGTKMNNFAQITEPAVAGAGQNLGSIGMFSAITAGTCVVFSDFSSIQPVNIGIQVILLATTGLVFTVY